MNAPDRLERRLPQLLDELAAARVPDYFDSLLEQTASTRQRPAWASLERWIPVDIATSAAPVRAVPWRPIVILAIVALLIAALAAVLIGSQPTKLPPPFGLARNGEVLVDTADGDIATLDLDTLQTRTIVDGETKDLAPAFTHLGQRFVFARQTAAGEEIWAADADGSDRRLILESGPTYEWLDWTPSLDRIVWSGRLRGVATAAIVDVASGASTPLTLGVEVTAPTWRPGHDEIVFFSPDRGYFRVNADGSGVRNIDAAFGSTDQFSLSGDGRRMAYMTWDDAPTLHGQIHVLDLDTEEDRIITTEGDPNNVYVAPVFSPDGTRVLADRHDLTDTYRVVVLEADGQSVGVATGPAHPTRAGGSRALWSPDATQILATYEDDKALWLLDPAGGPGRQLGSGFDGVTWQRLAP